MNSRDHAASPQQPKKDYVEACTASRLRSSPYPELRRVACEYHEGMLCLRGRVSSYYLKQMAQTTVLNVDGVDEMNNQLEVGLPPSRS